LVTVAFVSRYIALEGGDGSGKSTVAAVVAAQLEALGHVVIIVREPGGTPLGESIRELLLHSERLDHWAEVFLFAAQRAELAREVIAPALADGVWVISDRTYYSSIAYQGRGRGLGEGRIREINEIGLDGVVPDDVFVLDVEPATALARQDHPDRIGKEGIDFQTRVRTSYLGLAVSEPEKVRILDGSLPVDDLAEIIVGHIT
jgi:dTMP kinase